MTSSFTVVTVTVVRDLRRTIQRLLVHPSTAGSSPLVVVSLLCTMLHRGKSPLWLPTSASSVPTRVALSPTLDQRRASIDKGAASRTYLRWQRSTWSRTMLSLVQVRCTTTSKSSQVIYRLSIYLQYVDLTCCYMLFLVSGTSASSPFVAGLFALINSARLKVQKSSLGWINPTLYSLDPSIFNDVTQGRYTKIALSIDHLISIISHNSCHRGHHMYMHPINRQ